MTRLTAAEVRKLQKACQASFGTFGTNGTAISTEVRSEKKRARRRLRSMAYLEEQEQIDFINWVNDYRPYIPALKWLWHAANGEKREQVTRFDRRTGGSYQFSPTGLKLKRMGVLPGVSDLILDYPMPRDPGDPGPDGSGWYHGARFELKRVGGEAPTDAQAEYLRDMEGAGYFVRVCYGAEMLKAAVQDYLWIDCPRSLIPSPTPRPGPMDRKRDLVLTRPRQQKSARPSRKRQPLQLDAFEGL